MVEKRYSVETGKFGMYFYDNEKGSDLDLEYVALLLNELDEFKKYLRFIEVNKFK